MSGHARTVGTDLAPLAVVAVALGALLLEDELTLGGVAGAQDERSQGVDHLLAVGVGQAATTGKHLPGSTGEVPVGMIGQRLLLVKRQVVKPDGPPLDGAEQGRDPVVP